jgi:cytoskeleton protein RodZ
MSESIGQQLLAARLERGWSLAQVAQETHIREVYLAALESDEFSRLPSAVHVKGFLRLYAGLLGLDDKALLASLRGESPPAEEPAVSAQPIPPAETAAVEPIDQEAGEPPAETAAAIPPEVHEEPAAEEESGLDDIEAQTVGDEPAPATVSTHLKQSQQIFREVGEQLRHQRELLSLPLADVERYTHLRLHYLKAMEAGDMESLPSMVQGRGMLNNYARFLNLDADAILLRYAEGLQVRRQELMPAPSQPRAAAKQPSRLTLRRFLTMDLIIGGSLIVLVFAFLVWGASQVLTLRGTPTAQSTAPSIADVLLATPSLTATATLNFDITATNPAPTDNQLPVTLDATLAAGNGTPPAASSGAAIQVYVVARQQAFLRVTVDNAVKFNGRVLAGSAYTFTGIRQVELLTGDASALQVFYNQTDLGPLGGQGDVLDLVFSLKGIATPTPSITPTITRTVAPTWTQVPTRTPRPSQTPWPSQTPTLTPQS